MSVSIVKSPKFSVLKTRLSKSATVSYLYNFFNILFVTFVIGASFGLVNIYTNSQVFPPSNYIINISLGNMIKGLEYAVDAPLGYSPILSIVKGFVASKQGYIKIVSFTYIVIWLLIVIPMIHYAIIKQTCSKEKRMGLKSLLKQTILNLPKLSLTALMIVFYNIISVIMLHFLIRGSKMLVYRLYTISSDSKQIMYIALATAASLLFVAIVFILILLLGFFKAWVYHSFAISNRFFHNAFIDSFKLAVRNFNSSFIQYMISVVIYMIPFVIYFFVFSYANMTSFFSKTYLMLIYLSLCPIAIIRLGLYYNKILPVNDVLD